MKKQFILLFTGIVLIGLFFILPVNRTWSNTIIGYWKDFGWQKNKPDKQTRMRTRFGNDYFFSAMIADWMRNRGNHQQALILMPPTSYFKKMGFPYNVPEPAVFYYYTGIKTVWANSKEAINANWYVRVINRDVIIDSVTDRKSLQDTINAFQKMGVSL